jgi:hypothetical protein
MASRTRDMVVDAKRRIAGSTARAKRRPLGPGSADRVILRTRSVPPAWWQSGNGSVCRCNGHVNDTDCADHGGGDRRTRTDHASRRNTSDELSRRSSNSAAGRQSGPQLPPRVPEDKRKRWAREEHDANDPKRSAQSWLARRLPAVTERKHIENGPPSILSRR